MARPSTLVPISFSDIQTEFGGSNPIALSEYYGYGDFSSSGQISAQQFFVGGSAPIPQLTSSLESYSGQDSSWVQHTINTSAHAGQTAQLIVHYVSGSSFTGDIQFDAFNLGGTTYSFESSSDSFETNTNNTPTFSSVSWTGVGTSTSAYGRFVRDSGGTPSSSTGLSSAASGSYYVYAETSSSGYSYKNFWLKSPSFTVTNSTSYYVARYGATIGSVNIYLYY